MKKYLVIVLLIVIILAVFSWGKQMLDLTKSEVDKSKETSTMFSPAPKTNESVSDIEKDLNSIKIEEEDFSDI